jgi:hypothetical protein
MVGRPILAKAIRQLRNGPVGRTQIGFSAAWTMLPMRASLAMSDLPDLDMMDAPVHAIDDEAYAVAQFAHGRLQPLRQRPHPRLPFPGKPITLKRLEPADAERSVEISADLAGESCRVRYFTLQFCAMFVRCRGQPPHQAADGRTWNLLPVASA